MPAPLRPWEFFVGLGHYPPPPAPPCCPGDDRYDLGLAIKTSSRDVCVPGFSQPTEDGNGWTYSAAVITILQEYRKTYDWLWAYLIKTENEGLGKCTVLVGTEPPTRSFSSSPCP